MLLRMANGMHQKGGIKYELFWYGQPGNHLRVIRSKVVSFREFSLSFFRSLKSDKERIRMGMGSSRLDEMLADSNARTYFALLYKNGPFPTSFTVFTVCCS